MQGRHIWRPGCFLGAPQSTTTNEQRHTKEHIVEKTEKAGETQWAITTVDTQVVGEILAESLGAGTLTPFDLDRILVPAGGGLSWSIPTPKGEQNVPKFQAVILHHHAGRSYWALPFGEMEKQPPACTSLDGITGVGDPGGDCALCPKAAFGSKIVQGKPGKPRHASNNICCISCCQTRCFRSS